MPTNPLPIFDKRMLELINLLISNQTIKSKQDFYNVIGIARQQGNSIKNGIGSFKSEHILKACSEYNVNSGWIFGFDSNVFRSKVDKSAINKLGKQVNTSIININH